MKMSPAVTHADHEALNELLLTLLTHGRTHGVALLNPVQRVAFLVMELDAYAREEELQGFYAGPHGGRAGELVDALEGIGALQSGALIRQANSLFPHGRPSVNDAERLAELHAFDQARRDALHEIGREFLTYYDTLSLRIHTFARAKRDELAAGL